MASWLRPATTVLKSLSIVLPVSIYLAGLGMVLPQSIAGALTPFPERAGAASSLFGFVQQTLVNDYYPVGGAPAFGDIIVMLERGGQVVHSCVYIADNIVFTKNGASFSTPWQFARLENVAAFYSLNEPVELRRYRARNR